MDPPGYTFLSVSEWIADRLPVVRQYVANDWIESGVARGSDEFLDCDSRCLLCETGRMSDHIVWPHLNGSKHRRAYKFYCRTFETIVLRKRRERRLLESQEILLALTKAILCQRYGSLEAGKDSCVKTSDSIEDHFQRGLSLREIGPTFLWHNCLRFAAFKGHIVMELVMPYLQ